MKTIVDVVKIMDKLNPNDTEYCYNRDYFYENDEWYKKILYEVMKLQPKRVIDIGSNYNVHGYMFENVGIEYIGIEEYLNPKHTPYVTDKVKFVHKNYYDVREEYKDDVIISNLCVGYLIPVEDVKAKHLVVGTLDKNGYCSAKKLF